ncbi:MAG: chemotaxis protein CheW [Polyangiaceae bacterium]
MGPQFQSCTFSVERLGFAVEVERVQEVLRFCHVTKVPLAPAIVGGLMNLRGDIVTAIDMRPRLGLPPRAANVVPMAVVIRRQGGAVSLLVDRIGDVIEVAKDSLVAVPNTVPRGVRELSRGILPWERDLLLLLDTDRAVPEDAPLKAVPAPERVPSAFPRASDEV